MGGFGWLSDIANSLAQQNDTFGSTGGGSSGGGGSGGGYSLISPDTVIALPGGGQVSAGFLADQGIYSFDQASGQVVAPSDAYAVGFGGTTYQLAGQPWASDYSPQQQLQQQQQAQAGAAAGVAVLLREMGLEELIPDADKFVRGGGTWEEYELKFYDDKTKAGQIVNRIYPEWKARREAGNPIAIKAIVEYRAMAKSLFRSAGLPEGFWDAPDDFSKLIVNDVSPAELQTRIMDGYVRVANAPQEVKDALEQYYGVGAGGLAAYFLDEQRALPVLQRQVAAAEIGGFGAHTGFGAVSVTEAERLASEGITGDQAEQGFSQLASTRELFNPLDRGEDTIGRDEQLGAVFEGNANARRRIAERQRRRVAQFEGGGTLAQNRTGYAGLSTQT